MFDITIIGAGLAGLQLARLASREGASVLLVDARREVTDCVRTTGIFVRKTFEDFRHLDKFLGPAIRSIGVHSPAGRSIHLTSAHDEFRVGRMKPLYAAMLAQALAAGAQWRPATKYAGLSHDAEGTTVFFRDGTQVRTRFLVGADGARSCVARDLELDQNHAWITGVESVFPSAARTHPRFDCWIDPRLAPGYLAWIIDDGEETHVGVGGNLRQFDPSSSLKLFEARMRAEGRLPGTRLSERRGGLIPVNGVLNRIANSRGLLVGDAAGAVSPLTAGGLDACMRLSRHAATVLTDALREGGSLTAYNGAAFRSRFSSRIAMRHLFNIASRAPRAIELGFALGQMTAIRRAVGHIFFGRRSFPDLEGRPARPATCPP